MARLLIVEDDPAVRQLFADVFRDTHDIQFAPTGRAGGAAIFGDAQFDLIILDLYLNDVVNGIELTRLSKTVRPETPVIVVSGYIGDDTEDIDKGCKDLGAEVVLPKPVSPAQLVNTINQLLV